MSAVVACAAEDCASCARNGPWKGSSHRLDFARCQGCRHLGCKNRPPPLSDEAFTLALESSDRLLTPSAEGGATLDEAILAVFAARGLRDARLTVVAGPGDVHGGSGGTWTVTVGPKMATVGEHYAKVAERFAGEWSAFHTNGRGPFQTNNARRVAAAAARIIADAIRREEP